MPGRTSTVQNRESNIVGKIGTGTTRHVLGPGGLLLVYMYSRGIRSIRIHFINSSSFSRWKLEAHATDGVSLSLVILRLKKTES